MDAHKKASRQWQGKTALVDLVALAVARTLADVPELNGAVGESGSGTVDLAISLPGPGGTVWPVLRDASTKDLPSVAAERERLAEAAKGGSLSEADTAGATASLWNLGAHPVDLHVPGEVGPQIVRITVGRVLEKPISFQRMLTVRPRVWFSLAIDERAADAEAGGRFLGALQKRLNDLADSV
jgi:2-oxoglutarate dehydrogenase E2 component (dihydrolipoamide succinyltransferase)